MELVEYEVSHGVVGLLEDGLKVSRVLEVGQGVDGVL